MALDYHIAVIAGDGIGPEVMPQGCKVLRAVADALASFQFVFEELPWGSAYYQEHGRMMPADGLEVLKEFDAIYLGAVGLPSAIPDHVTLWDLVLPIRKSFDQYVNLRPVRLLPGLTGPLRKKGPEEIDFLIVRENTEGEYSGVGGRIHRGTQGEVALQTSVFTRRACERLIRYGFELAKTRSKKKVTSVTKSNAMQYSMVLWDEVFAEVARDYPPIQTEKWHVDAMAARFVSHPETLDVVVASNLFADILSDLGGSIQGSLGMCPSANINPERKWPSMFEPIHGSAPDIAGKGIANPIGMIWSGAMMLDFLREVEAANIMMQALERTVSEGRFLTRDIGGKAGTVEVGDEIARHVYSLAEKRDGLS